LTSIPLSIATLRPVAKALYSSYHESMKLFSRSTSSSVTGQSPTPPVDPVQHAYALDLLRAMAADPEVTTCYGIRR
jgi:hypothetical protein